MINIAELQKRLAEKGFDPGPIDGVIGPLTRRAISRFQERNGFPQTGVLNLDSLNLLFPGIDFVAENAIPINLPWIVEAHRLIGVKEIEGEANSQTIMNWADVLDIGYSSDEVAWCGLFVAHCISSQLPGEPLPNNPLGARKWKNFGREVEPQLGAVLVFWRSSPDSWKGHVGFYWAEDETHYHVLGGNQSNSVNVKRITKKRLIAARWPNGEPDSGIVRLASSAGVLESVTEA